MFRPIAIASVVLLAAGCVAPHSHDLQAKPQIAVDYGDLNLSHKAGASAVLGRIKAASHIVCGKSADHRDLARFMAHRECTTKAMDDAVASLGHPLVATLHGKPELAANAMPTASIPATETDTSKIRPELD